MDKDTDKINVSLAKETIQWLSTTYPDALSTPEAIRDAIKDARDFQDMKRDVDRDS